MLIMTGAATAAAEVASDAIAKAQTPAISPVLGGSMVSSSLKMIGALFFCLGVFAIGVRLARRFGPTPKTLRRRRIEVRERLSLNSKSAIFLIAVDNREYLVTSGSEQTSILPAHSVSAPMFSESLDEIYDESGEAHV
jgi:flagellar biogenesis protein FliO